MRKKITHKAEMSSKILKGISEISSIVKRTLGPGGLPIIIERLGQSLNGDRLGPIITKDGVTVAQECQDPDSEIDVVIQAVKDICTKTNRIAGDGTTTAIVLGEAILSEALKELEANPELNPQLLREDIEREAKDVTEILKLMSQEVKDLKKIAEVATISANGDNAIGAIIQKAFEAVGSEGVITVDEGHGTDTSIDVVEGYQIKRGAEAQDRFFNNAESSRFEADDCYVILYNGTLRNYTKLIPALKAIGEEVVETGKKAMPPILVVADEFSNEIIQYLLINKAENGLAVCAVRSPHMTNIRTSMMDDLAVILGGNRLGNGNRDIDSCTLDDIGIAGKVVVDKYSATFYDGYGEDDDVLKRIDQLKAQKQLAESPYDAQLIADRIASLSQGIAKIGVGGSTDLEIKEKYHRIEDALNAARAAIEEGIIPGGGTTFLRIAQILEQKENKTSGTDVLIRALKYPFNQILENIGIHEEKIKEKLQKKILQDSTKTVVYNARNKVLEDSFEAGIIDPTKVTRTAFENAVSIAALLSTCGGAITYSREK